MSEQPAVDLRTERPHSARVYDYLLGGKDNYAADRAVGDAILARHPSTPTGMRANRAFMRRAGRHLAVEHGMRQFFDLGTGIPTSPNLHEVVQEVAPDSRVVYLDNDPIVLAHARALMTSTPEGATAYVDADLRDPARALSAPQLLATLDLDRPVAVLFIGAVHVLLDDEVEALLAAVHEAVAPGSYLAMTVLTDDFDPEGMAIVQQAYRSGGETMELRTRADAERLFGGWDLVEPGIVQIQHWHPELTGMDSYPDTAVAAWGGIARRP